MILGSWRSRIGIPSLDKRLDVLDCVSSDIKDIFFRCRCADEVIGSSVLNIILDALHFKVHRLLV